MPHNGESHDDFMSRCMGHGAMKSEFPNHDQRLAVCSNQAKKRHDDGATLDRRYLQTTDLRVATGDHLRPKLIGHAVVFNALSEPIGVGWRERIAPEAVDRTFAEGIDVRALIDHEPAKILGRVSAGTMKISKEAQGLLVEIDPPDTSYARDALESVRRGDLTGMSFAFRLLDFGWADNEEDVRIVKDMRISEVSIVTFPAYPQTDVELAQRSLEAHRQSRHVGPPLSVRRRALDISA